MSITNIVIGVVVFIVLVLIVKYITGRHKLPSQRSNSERLANTLHTKFEKFMKDLNNGIQTPEDVQEEMLAAIDDFKLEKLEQIKTTATRMVENLNAIKANRENLTKTKAVYDKQAEESKRQLKTTNDETEKQQIVERGAMALKQSKTIQKSIDATDTAIKAMQSQVDKLHNFTTSFTSKIEMKRTEVLTMISTYIASDNGASMNFDFTIDDLMNDYKTKMDVENEKNTIEKLSRAYVSQDTDDTLTDEDLEAFKNL